MWRLSGDGDQGGLTMAEPTLEVFGTRKPGRPRSRDPLEPVTVWVSKAEYARLETMAHRRRASISATARLLIKALDRVSDRRG